MTVFYNIVTTEAASDGAGVPRSVHGGTRRAGGDGVPHRHVVQPLINRKIGVDGSVGISHESYVVEQNCGVNTVAVYQAAILVEVAEGQRLTTLPTCPAVTS